MVVMMVVVWTVSWPRRERCPGTLRVTIPRPLRRFSSFFSTAVSLLFTQRALPFSVYSLFLFSFYILSVNLSPAFPRSFYRGLPRAGRPFRAARLTNMAVVRSLPFFAAPTKKTYCKKAHREEFAFYALESELFTVFFNARFYQRNFASLRKTSPLPSIDSNRA